MNSLSLTYKFAAYEGAWRFMVPNPGSDRNTNQQPFNDRNRSEPGIEFEGDMSDQVLQSTCLTSRRCSPITTSRDDLSPSLKFLPLSTNSGGVLSSRSQDKCPAGLPLKGATV